MKIWDCPKCLAITKTDGYIQRNRACATVADHISLLEEIAELHDKEHK